MSSHCFDLSLRVLISCEGKHFLAHALEVDLVGQGDTEQEACNDLTAAVSSQLSFAAQMKNPDLIGQKAPIEYFVRWEEAQACALRGVANGDKAKKVKVQARATLITIPRKVGRRAEFELMPALA